MNRECTVDDLKEMMGIFFLNAAEDFVETWAAYKAEVKVSVECPEMSCLGDCYLNVEKAARRLAYATTTQDRIWRAVAKVKEETENFTKPLSRGLPAPLPLPPPSVPEYIGQDEEI